MKYKNMYFMIIYDLPAKALYSADDPGTEEASTEMDRSNDFLKKLKEGPDKIMITASRAPSSGNPKNHEHTSS